MLCVTQSAQMHVFPSQKTHKIKGFMKQNPQGIFFRNYMENIKNTNYICTIQKFQQLHMSCNHHYNYTSV